MKRNRNIWLTALGLLLAAVLLAPGSGMAKEEGKDDHWGVEREKLAKELNLAPDKTKEFLAVSQKYEKSREEIRDRIKKNYGELEKALAAPQPDETKVKELVGAITADHDKFLDSLRAQRQEEMAVLTPVQQGRFVLFLRKWHEEMKEKYQKKEEKK